MVVRVLASIQRLLLPCEKIELVDFIVPQGLLASPREVAFAFYKTTPSRIGNTGVSWDDATLRMYGMCEKELAKIVMKNRSMGDV